jgi:DNA polymerase-1
MKELFLLDASGYLYRSYFAIRGITNGKGESTNALFGFIRSILKLQKDFPVTHFAAVFDGPKGIEKRVQIYRDYKAHRAKMPDDLRYQMGWAQQFCDLYGLPKLVIEGVEADDTLGACAQVGLNHSMKTYLCTTDKDLAQLVNDHVFLLNTFKENLISGAKEVEETFGVPPEKMVDYLAICGDASDNVPGISGIGPKTASTLLKTYGSLDQLLQIPEGLTPKQKSAFEENKEIVLMSRDLVTIDTNVVVPQDLDFYQIKKCDPEPLKAFYASMGFNSLLKELKETAPQKEEVYSYELIESQQALEKLIEELQKQKELCFDTETTSINPLVADIVGIGIGYQEGKAWYIPLNGNIEKAQALALLKPLFENPEISFYGHNVKYDWHVMKGCGITIKNIGFDTIIASYLLNSHQRQHSLDHLCLTLFGKVKIPITDLIGKGKNEISMLDVPIEKVATYCAEDVDYTIRLKNVLEKQLKERGLEKLFYKIELPLLSVLAHMEQNGIYVDTTILKKQGIEISKECQNLAEQIYQLAGQEFNINSPKQVSEILFGKIGIRPPKKTETGFSTSAQVLEEIEHLHPIIGKILEYRTVEKLRSTYIETLPLEVNPKTGRIHPNFNQSGTATGRLSCQDPNLQNIPIRTDVGSRIREAFEPQVKTASFLSADYSQIELRILAHFSEDPNLIQAFLSGVDIHAYTASLVFGISPKDVTKEQRRQAKAVNFGIIYGQQAFGLSKELGISVDEAKKFIAAYFQQYPKVKDFLESCKESARKTSKAVTICGRERQIPEILSKNPQLRGFAERLAINTPLQGTAADLIKIAMIGLDKILEKNPQFGKMVLQIHDELIFEVPDSQLDKFSLLVKETMEGALKFKVPLIVDISVGKNWKSC